MTTIPVTAIPAINNCNVKESVRKFQSQRLAQSTTTTQQGWGQVQLVKYSNTSSTRNQVQVQVLCIFTNQVLTHQVGPTSTSVNIGWLYTGNGIRTESHRTKTLRTKSHKTKSHRTESHNIKVDKIPQYKKLTRIMDLRCFYELASLA